MQTFVLWKTLKLLLAPIFHGYTRSKTTLAKGACILTQVRVNFPEEVFNVQSFTISCAELWARKFALRSAKLQMFDDQSCHVWHPIRACFGVGCPRLDASDSMSIKIDLLVRWLDISADLLFSICSNISFPESRLKWLGSKLFRTFQKSRLWNEEWWKLPWW